MHVNPSRMDSYPFLDYYWLREAGANMNNYVIWELRCNTSPACLDDDISSMDFLESIF